MKRILLVLVLMVFAIISACSNGESKASENKSEDTKSKETQPVSDEQEEESDGENEQDKEDEEEQENVLTKVGQTTKDHYGDIELLKIKEINEIIEQGSLKIKLIDAKIIKRTNLSGDFISYINQFEQVNKGDDVTYLQLRYDVENTSDQDIYWDGLTNIVTDQKEQIDAMMKEILLQGIDNDFLGKVKKEYYKGFILNKPDANEFRLIFGAVSDNSTFDQLADEVEYKFSFE